MVSAIKLNMINEQIKMWVHQKDKEGVGKRRDDAKHETKRGETGAILSRDMAEHPGCVYYSRRARIRAIDPLM